MNCIEVKATIKQEDFTGWNWILSRDNKNVLKSDSGFLRSNHAVDNVQDIVDSLNTQERPIFFYEKRDVGNPSNSWVILEDEGWGYSACLILDGPMNHECITMYHDTVNDVTELLNSFSRSTIILEEFEIET